MIRHAARPAWIGELDLSGPPELPAEAAGCDLVYALLRWGGEPVGRLVLQTHGTPVEPDRLRRLVEAALPERLAARWRAGEPPPAPGPAETAAGPPASVVVPTRDRPEDLDLCLAALRALEGPPPEIIVVDSAGRGGAAQAIARRHGVRCVREEIPGLSRARNRGLREAGGEIVAFLDDDCRADPGWLRAIASAFRRTAAAAVAGPILPRELDTEAQRLFLRYTFTDRRGFERSVFDGAEVESPDGARRPVSPVWPVDSWRAGGGGNTSFDRRAALAAGGFDEALGAGTPARGGEDLMMLYRLAAAGLRICHEPAAIVWHRHWRGNEELRRLLFRHGAGHTAYLLACWRDGRHRGRLARYAAGFLYDRVTRMTAAAIGMKSYPPSLPLRELAGSAAGLWLAGRARRAAGRHRSAAERGVGPGRAAAAGADREGARR